MSPPARYPRATRGSWARCLGIARPPRATRPSATRILFNLGASLWAPLSCPPDRTTSRRMPIRESVDHPCHARLRLRGRGARDRTRPPSGAVRADSIDLQPAPAPVHGPARSARANWRGSAPTSSTFWTPWTSPRHPGRLRLGRPRRLRRRGTVVAALCRPCVGQRLPHPGPRHRHHPRDRTCSPDSGTSSTSPPNVTGEAWRQPARHRQSNLGQELSEVPLRRRDARPGHRCLRESRLRRGRHPHRSDAVEADCGYRPV
jgi:hypothetical protein